MTISSVSVVIAVKDEDGDIEKLAKSVIAEIDKSGNSCELIIIDDGSTDNSWKIITSLVDDHPGIVVGQRFRCNMGKAQALAAGFRLATGEIVITMDGDLQDIPTEIPKFLKTLDEESCDLVVGWKYKRRDSPIKVISSWIFNLVANYFSGLSLNDHNCGFKCYRKQVLSKLVLYGDMHRMIPFLVAAHGFKITEVKVEHAPRINGVSKYGKYGFGRAVRSFFDLFTVLFLRRYYDRPAHLFGILASLLLLGGTGIFGLGLYKNLFFDQGKLMVIIGPVIFIAGLVVMCIGFLAELLVYSFIRDGKFPPPIAETIGLKNEVE